MARDREIMMQQERVQYSGVFGTLASSDRLSALRSERQRARAFALAYLLPTSSQQRRCRCSYNERETYRGLGEISWANGHGSNDRVATRQHDSGGSPPSSRSHSLRRSSSNQYRGLSRRRRSNEQPSEQSPLGHPSVECGRLYPPGQKDKPARTYRRISLCIQVDGRASGCHTAGAATSRRQRSTRAQIWNKRREHRPDQGWQAEDSL